MFTATTWPSVSPAPPAPWLPDGDERASALTHAALAAIGSPAGVGARTDAERWRPLLDAVEQLVEVTAAAHALGIHRRVAVDTGLQGLPSTRGRARSACGAVVRLLAAAHRDLDGAPASRWSNAVARRADEVVDRWSGDLDRAVERIPVLLARELAAALAQRDDEGEGPGAALVGAAGAALALYLLSGPYHEQRAV